MEKEFTFAGDMAGFTLFASAHSWGLGTIKVILSSVWVMYIKHIRQLINFCRHLLSYSCQSVYLSWEEGRRLVGLQNHFLWFRDSPLRMLAVFATLRIWLSSDQILPVRATYDTFQKLKNYKIQFFRSSNAQGRGLGRGGQIVALSH